MYVITGGGSGIGQALAWELASRGQAVFIIGRRVNALKETALYSSKIQYCVADVSTSEGRDLISLSLEKISIKAMIHNAGIIHPIEKISSVNLNDWENIVKTNLFSPLRLTQLLLDNLQDSRVLHIGSGAAYIPIVGWSGYCVSKAALSMLTRCCQAEIKNPIFSSVMPGIIDTAMTAEIRNSKQEMSSTDYHFHHSLYDEKRLIQPRTVAVFLAWLLMETDEDTFVSKEWDIYDTSHHPYWLKPPHQVLPLD